MSQIEPIDWLHWHGGRKAQQHAIRLCCFCSSVLPADKNFRELVQDEIVTELIELALHGRRTMELLGQKSATIGDDPLWPAATQAKTDLNLFDAFGSIVHSREITVNWEQTELQPNPYKGRTSNFAASITVKSDTHEHTIPIGAIAASFIGFLNRASAQEQSSAQEQ